MYVHNYVYCILGTWPWITAVGFRNCSNTHWVTQWLCGSTLISARHVLTAAHCAIRSDLYVVRIADLNLKRDDDGAHPIQMGFESKLIHPDYIHNIHNHDIAILRLVEEVPFSSKFQFPQILLNIYYWVLLKYHFLKFLSNRQHGNWPINSNVNFSHFPNEDFSRRIRWSCHVK